jgi:tetratricopeptide (TPR) repeat protein
MSQANAKHLQDQGIKLFQQKEYEDAAKIFQQAHDAYTAESQPDLAAEMLVNIGMTHRSLGQHERALELMSQALETFQAANDTRRVAMVLGNMGAAYKAMGDKEQAYNCYRDAADAFSSLGEKKLYGETLLAIADLQMSDRKIGQAAATYEVGLSELDDLSASQKVLKGLVGFRNKLMGTPDITESSSDSADQKPADPDPKA